MDTEDWRNVSEDALKNIIMQLTVKHQESMNRTVEYQANIGTYTDKGPYYSQHFTAQEQVWQRILSKKIMTILNELIRRQKQENK